MNREETITITMKEYKELLEIKGRYEELKNIYQLYYKPIITDNGIRLYDNELKPPYKVTVTCDTESEV